MTDHMIYDYETLGQNPVTSPVVNCAKLIFQPERFLEKPYTWEELLEDAHFIKFDAASQVRDGRIVEDSTMEWWKSQSPEAQRQLLPSNEDRPLSEAISFLMTDAEQVWTRGNSFDPVFTTFICNEFGLSEPYPFWAIRDTRTFIEAVAMGTGLASNKFIPRGLESKFIAHDPIHDIAMDVMRMQEVVNWAMA